MIDREYLKIKLEEIRKLKLSYEEYSDGILDKDICEYLMKKSNHFIKKKLAVEGYRGDKVDKNAKNCSDYFLIHYNNVNPDIEKDKKLLSTVEKLREIVSYHVYFYLLNVGYLGCNFMGVNRHNVNHIVKDKSVLPEFYNEITLDTMTLRKYTSEKGGGYHIPHFDSQAVNNKRILTVIFYLNDIKHGGETEFPVLNKCIQAKQGRMLLFPPYYTHVHIGRTAPIDRYIISCHLSEKTKQKENK